MHGIPSLVMTAEPPLPPPFFLIFLLAVTSDAVPWLLFSSQGRTVRGEALWLPLKSGAAMCHPHTPQQETSLASGVRSGAVGHTGHGLSPYTDSDRWRQERGTGEGVFDGTPSFSFF